MSPLRVFLCLLVLAAGGVGYLAGKKQAPVKIAGSDPETFPLTEYKSFAIVVYACNQATWCERTLKSIFEQDYDHYRVVFIDDASNDGTYEKASDFILESNEERRAILIRNETRLGPVGSLYRAIDGCLDREIAIPLDAKDWLAHPSVLSQLNAAYQNPDVWYASGQAVEYPSYAKEDAAGENASCSFYAGLMKQIRLEDLTQEGRFTVSKKAYQVPLRQLAGKRIALLHKTVAFDNTATWLKYENEFERKVSYSPLAEFPRPR